MWQRWNIFVGQGGSGDFELISIIVVMTCRARLKEMGCYCL